MNWQRFFMKTWSFVLFFIRVQVFCLYFIFCLDLCTEILDIQSDSLEEFIIISKL